MLLWSKRAHYLSVALQISAEITNQQQLLSACLSTPSPRLAMLKPSRIWFPSSHWMRIWESVQREPFDCINDKWESVSDLSPEYRFLSDHRPLEMNGQISLQAAPFDMRGLALMHMWWLSNSAKCEWDLTTLSTFSTVIITDRICKLTFILVEQTCGRSAHDDGRAGKL